MAAETNLITTKDVAPAITIDVINQFNKQFNGLKEVLKVVNVNKVREGMVIKPLTAAKVTLADGKVAEGDIIPLSKVETSESAAVEIVLKKYRKATSAEAIGRVGFENAVNNTDSALVREIQKGVRTELFTYLGTGTGSATGENLQAALAQAYAQVSIKFEDDATQSVAFISPLDLADYQAKAQISLQTQFGLKYLQNFLGYDVVIVMNSVPKGTIYATALSNIALYVIDMNLSDIAKAFNLRSDDSGLIGLTHYPTNERAQIETLLMSGIYLIAERLDGVVKATIAPGV